MGGMGGMNTGMGGPGGRGTMPMVGPGGVRGGGMGSMGGMSSSMGMGGFPNDPSASAGSGPVSTMGGMMGGGVKGGPTSGGMMSTPRAMGPGSTSTMGSGMGGIGGTGGMRMMGRGGPNVSMVPPTPNTMVGGGMGGMGGGMSSSGNSNTTSSVGFSGSMIRPGSGTSGMRMPISTSTPPVGAMPINQSSTLGGVNSSMMTNTSSSMLSTSGTTPSTAASTPNNTQSTDSGVKTENSQSGDTSAQQTKDPNTITICSYIVYGQEAVEEIGNRTLEIFSILKSLQPPVGQYNHHSIQSDRGIQDKQTRVQELLRMISKLFVRLRVCWEKCEESTASIEHQPLPNLIPIKDDSDPSRGEIEKKRGENYRSALDEHNELIQQIILKNRHLKDIIDHLRNTIWEVNTMLAMRT